VVISGPNGAGKSTIAADLLTGPLRVRHYVNADVIARGLSEFASEEMAIPAGKIMLTQLWSLAEQRVSFGFETTLASRTFAPWLRTLVSQGYSFHLLYLWLPTVEMARERVGSRVFAGGHGIPADTIERRYYRGIRNFFTLYRPLAKSWRVYNNSEREGPLLVASGGMGKMESIYVEEQWRTFSSLERRG
jgi:predicted ABC-type ATPase